NGLVKRQRSRPGSATSARWAAGARCPAQTALPAALAARCCAGAEARSGVHVRGDDREGTPPLVKLKALCGPGDDGAPVLTVLLPDEDEAQARHPGRRRNRTSPASTSSKVTVSSSARWSAPGLIRRTVPALLSEAMCEWPES